MKPAAPPRRRTTATGGRPRGAPVAGRSGPGKGGHGGGLLGLAAELMAELLRDQGPADGVVQALMRRHPTLGPRERHALADTAYAMLRRRPLWLHLASSGAGPLPRRLALLAWAGAAGSLEAGASAEERAWREAMLQRVDEPPRHGPATLRHQLPVWLADQLQLEMGGEEFWRLASALLEPAPLDLRVNLLKAKRDDVLARLRAEGHAVQATPWSPWGLRLAGKPSLQRWPAYLAGEVEVQDEGSQLLALLLGPKRGEMVVDFCAGAGGKTLALGAMMRSTGRLYAMDVSGHRLAALKPRLQRSGLSNVHTVQIAHERDERIKRLAGKVARVLVDAPCSGLGTLRRNPDLKWRQSPEEVGQLAARQTAILAAAATLVAPGGRLVYATCSLLRQENEAVAEAFGAAHGAFTLLPAQALLAPSLAEAQALVQGPWLRLWPYRHGTDGFFAAAWQRGG